MLEEDSPHGFVRAEICPCRTCRDFNRTIDNPILQEEGNKLGLTRLYNVVVNTFVEKNIKERERRRVGHELQRVFKAHGG